MEYDKGIIYVLVDGEIEDVELLGLRSDDLLILLSEGYYSPDQGATEFTLARDGHLEAFFGIQL